MKKLFKNKKNKSKTKYEQERVAEFIQTYTGKKFYPLNPRPEDISIEDVAHALSNICRFTGHGKRFYSVGEHSIWCAIVAHEQGYDILTQLYCLLHDTSESIVSDLNRPLKQNLPQYIEVEDKVMQTMWKLFKVPPPTEEHYSIVKKIDNTLLVSEMRDLMTDLYIPNEFDYIKEASESIDLNLEGFSAGNSKNAFLEIYEVLINKYEKGE